MSAMVFEFDNEIKGSAKIKVLGVGGGGCNAIDSMIDMGLKGVEFIALNTDAQALQCSKANTKIQIGSSTTKGLGAGADPEVGRQAMEEDREKLTNILSDADMVFIAAGMGGGTGTGAAGVIAEISNQIGALTVAIVTKPFKFEGQKRFSNAEKGIQKLKEFVDALIIVHNQRLAQSTTDPSTSIKKAFLQVDEVLYKAVRGIADLITYRGNINLDFADIKTIMKGMGEAMMGVGEAEGEHACIEAAQTAIQSALLENIDIKGAKGLLVNISANEELTLFEVDQAMDLIYQATGTTDVNVIFGVVSDNEMQDKVRVTVIATGFDTVNKKEKKNEFEKINLPKGIKSAIIDKDSQVHTKYSKSQFTNYEVPAFLRMNKD
ncbi:MAG: cell division protein FtsZ [Candidatus Delongbacteria bacterium]|nr:cell division protein FtsZ [Candidatus Delongbacteria bacterium]MCG2760883.1 cell division protein FtsZ [Candidatus Delongbacteria bacterium]